MSVKPKIHKDEAGWLVELPAFGFGRESRKGPFRTHGAALRWVAAQAVGAAGPSIERATTPQGYSHHDGWPMEVR